MSESQQGPEICDVISRKRYYAEGINVFVTVFALKEPSGRFDFYCLRLLVKASVTLAYHV